MLKVIGERIRASTIARIGAFCLAYLAGAELARVLSFSSQDQVVVILWFPAGLFLAALTMSRYQSWLPIVLAAWGANLVSDVLLHDKSVPVSIGFCVAHTVEACLGALLLRRFAGIPVTLDRLKEVVALACCSALFGAMVGATIGAMVVVAAFDEPLYSSVWQTWWSGDALGVLVVAPVVFTWATGPATFLKEPRSWRIAENAVVLVGMILVTEFVYGNGLPRSLRVPIFILPFLLWSGFRLGPRSAATAVLVVALIGMWNVSEGRGPYAVSFIPVGEQLLRAQGTLGTTSLCVLLLAATVAERNQATRDRIALLAELQTALAEIKTLRGFIPICAWCKSIRDDKDFWHSVEDYLVKHTEAQFSHSICPECLAKVMSAQKQSSP